MKHLNRVLAMVVMLSLFVNVARAAEETSKTRFIGGVGIGGAVQGTGFSSYYSGGGGIDGYVGLAFNQNLSLLLAIDSFVFPTSVTGYYSTEVNFSPSVKYAFGDSPTKFYLIGGLGVNDNIFSYSSGSTSASTSESSLEIEPGAGVDIFLNDALSLYVQAKFVDVFAASTFSYFPITLGLDFK